MTSGDRSPSRLAHAKMGRIAKIAVRWIKFEEVYSQGDGTSVEKEW
jgi:hypothetical protein